MASNRRLKLQLYSKNPHCHWCGRKTILTNIPEIKGKPDPLMATIDHLVSRYHPERWVAAKRGEPRKVLACYECNQKRSVEETQKLPRDLLIEMSRGFSLNPRGFKKVIFPKTASSLIEVFDKLKERGIDSSKISAFINSLQPSA